MRPIEVGAELVYKVECPTVLLINVSVAQTDHQQILKEQLSVEPEVALDPCKVGWEQNRFHRLRVEPCELRINYQATVQLRPVTSPTPQIQQIDCASLPAEVLPYLNPSRYCESDRIMNYAFAQFGTMAANFERVDAICDWIHSHLTYQSGSTDSSTTACDVLIQRNGVCRDYAHLAIAFCRALGIPARYVSGYACRLQPPDFHGFLEAYLEDRWYLFDPTRLAPPAGLVRIGVGRDAADTAFCTIWGSAQMQSMNVWANEFNGNESLLNASVSDTAVSTA